MAIASWLLFYFAGPAFEAVILCAIFYEFYTKSSFKWYSLLLLPLGIFPLVGGIRQDWEEKRALYSRLMLISTPIGIATYHLLCMGSIITHIHTSLPMRKIQRI